MYDIKSLMETMFWFVRHVSWINLTDRGWQIVGITLAPRIRYHRHINIGHHFWTTALQSVGAAAAVVWVDQAPETLGGKIAAVIYMI